MTLLIYKTCNKLINVLTKIRYRAWSRIITRPDAVEVLR